MIWNHILSKTMLSRLLDAPVFLMAELEVGEIPSKPMDLSFVEGWRANIIMRVPLTPEFDRTLEETKVRRNRPKPGRGGNVHVSAVA